MLTRQLTLNDANGLHLRVAGAIAQVALTHNARVTVSCEGCRLAADACSILQLLMMGAPLRRRAHRGSRRPGRSHRYRETGRVAGGWRGYLSHHYFPPGRSAPASFGAGLLPCL